MVFVEKYFTLQTSQWGQLCCRLEGVKNFWVVMQLQYDSCATTLFFRVRVEHCQAMLVPRRGCFAVVSHRCVKRSLFALMENILSPGSPLHPFQITYMGVTLVLQL